jgi:hypothetical protein
MSLGLEPQSFTTLHGNVIAESIADAKKQLQCGEQLLDRSQAEELLPEIEASTGKRHYIFALEIRIQQVTA